MFVVAIKRNDFRTRRVTKTKGLCGNFFGPIDSPRSSAPQ